MKKIIGYLLVAPAMLLITEGVITLVIDTVTAVDPDAILFFTVATVIYLAAIYGLNLIFSNEK